MAQLSSDDFRAYCDAVQSIADFASEIFIQAVEAVIGDIDIDALTLEEKKQLRNTIIELALHAEELTYDSSATLGAEMAEQAAQQCDVEVVKELGEVNEDRVNRSTRARARAIFKQDPDFVGFIDSVSSMVNDHIRHASDWAVMETVSATNKSGKNKRELRFARVPQGPTCAFCIMLASRGFVYTTEEKGTHRKSDGDKFHPGCDCKAMPGVNGITKIEGYNPDELLKRYYDCLATINDGHTTLTEGPLYEDFKRDVPEEKRKEPNAFNDYCEKRIVQEMETRDRRWLYDGTVPKPDINACGPNDNETALINVLAGRGFSIKLIPREERGPRKGDALLSGIQFEFKCPTVWQKYTVKNQLVSALYSGENHKVFNPQCDRVVISGVSNGATVDEMVFWLKKVLAGEPKFTVDHIEYIKEILLVDANGEIRRIRND